MTTEYRKPNQKQKKMLNLMLTGASLKFCNATQQTHYYNSYYYY